MSKRGKILHRQTFQNSNNIVEFTVKTIPKDKVPDPKASTAQKPFVRDCALRKELEKAVDDKNNNVNIKRKALKKLPSPKASSKPSGGRVTVEVSNKSSKKHHKFVPPNKTWGDVLRSCSTINSFNESDNIEHLSRGRREECSAEKRRNRTQGSTQSLETEQSSTPDLIVNQRIQSEETSSQECRPLGMNANAEEHSSSSQVRNDRNKPRRLRIRSPNHIRNSQLNNNNNARGPMANSHEDQQPELARQAKGPGTNRLLSDDVNASPFGESALQLLHQLRERLQARGDCEGMNMVGAFEKYITGQGSTGGVGVSNIPHANSSVSPVCLTVFPTPSSGPLPSHCQQSQSVRSTQAREMQNQYTFHSTAQRAQPFNYPTEDFHQVPTSQSYIQQQYESNLQERQPKFNQSSRQEQGQVNSSKAEDLRREMERKEKIIQEQQDDLLQLRALCTRLISQQEQVQAREAASNRENLSRNGLQENPQTVSRVTQTNEFQTEKVSLVQPTNDRDSSTPASSASQMDREYRSKLIQLQTENETLRREVRSHRDLILNLENQLTRVYQELESERHSRSRLSSSRLSGSAPNLDHFGRLYKETGPEKLIQSKPPSHHGESEADSAYEEKTSSQVTSKVSSPHVDKKEEQDGSGQSKVSSLPSRDKDTHHFKAADSHHHRSHPTQNSTTRQEYSVPSITRNVTSASPQPVSQNAILSVALSDSSLYSNSEAYKLSHQSLNQKHSNPEISVWKLQDKVIQARAQIEHMDNNDGIQFRDINPEPGQGLHTPACLSFTTVSEESQQDKTIYQESSFLHGIPHSGSTQGSDTTRNFQIDRDTLDSINVLSGPAMESTRLKEKSCSYVRKENTSESSFLPMSVQKTLISGLNVIDELQ